MVFLNLLRTVGDMIILRVENMYYHAREDGHPDDKAYKIGCKFL
jgi:hypothetical protein